MYANSYLHSTETARRRQHCFLQQAMWARRASLLIFLQSSCHACSTPEQAAPAKRNTQNTGQAKTDLPQPTHHTLVLLVLPKRYKLALLGSTCRRVRCISFSKPSMMPRPPVWMQKKSNAFLKSGV